MRYNVIMQDSLNLSQPFYDVQVINTLTIIFMSYVRWIMKIMRLLLIWEFLSSGIQEILFCGFLLLQCVVYVCFIPQITVWTVCLFTMCYHDPKLYKFIDIKYILYIWRWVTLRIFIRALHQLNIQNKYLTCDEQWSNR